MTVATHPLADDYLRSLDRAARVLPRSQRSELLAEIRSHLDAGLSLDATEADVRNLLDDLGSPADIVAAAQPGEVPTRRGAREVFALVFLVLGFPPLLGWLIGVGLLAWSPLWSVRQKVLGILVWPGGVLLGVFYFGSLLNPLENVKGRSRCWSTATSVVCEQRHAAIPAFIGDVLGILLIVAPLLVAVHLYRAAGRRARAV